MASIELKHLDCLYPEDWIKAEVSNQLMDEYKPKDVIRISCVEDCVDVQILLDKSTAIKFAKTLRTEINKIEE